MALDLASLQAASVLPGGQQMLKEYYYQRLTQLLY